MAEVDDHVGDDAAKDGEKAGEDDDSGNPIIDSVESPPVTSPASPKHPQGPVAEETET